MFLFDMHHRIPYGVYTGINKWGISGLFPLSNKQLFIQKTTMGEHEKIYEI